MDVAPLFGRLERFPAALGALVSPLPVEDWRWRPEPRAWSVLEIVHHLLDEEVEDFRARTASLLADPAGPWPSLDPERLVVERRYQERDPAAVLAAFREERARSVAWLRSLASPRWDRARERPGGIVLRAGDLLASWDAHDARHLQQLGKRLHGLAARDGAPYSVAYAG